MGGISKGAGGVVANLFWPQATMPARRTSTKARCLRCSGPACGRWAAALRRVGQSCYYGMDAPTGNEGKVTNSTIRKLQPNEIDIAVDIWLRASIGAHSFIAQEFWESGVDAMREEYLPSSENWALEHDGEVAGFLSLEGNMVAALFVDPERQGQGFGALLLDKAKSLHHRLVVSVYEENERAIEFYRRHGFSCVDQRNDVHTKHLEWVMEWEGP